MSKQEKPNEIEAIRIVIDSGAVGDYCDVVDEVKKRFGLIVAASQVEQIHTAMKAEASTREQIQQQHDSRDSANASTRKAIVLEFVEEMGGINEAKAAISDLERTIKRLVR